MLHAIDALIPQRYWAWSICALLAVVSPLLLPMGSFCIWPAAIFALLTWVGLLDYAQPRQAIRRNYPVLAHFRFFFEFIRPEIRQYFIEADTEELPFARSQRSIIYQRAKNAADKRPFGTQLNVYEPNYEWINHSIAPSDIASHDFRISIGGPHCRAPYSASIFNISAMSFGALSANAILALNEGAKRGRFYHDTGEGSISCYHRERGGDIVWEVGSGYFGCRSADGKFDAAKFADAARSEQVKMIEIKLSQGAKPGTVGGLPVRGGLMPVHNTLVGVGLRGRTKIGASGKILPAFDIARPLAMGADWCNSARGFMFALGCLQAQTCHTGKCPTGVTTQDPKRMRALVVPDKAERVYQFQQNTLAALKELLAAAGLQHPADLGPEHVIRRVSSTEVRSLAALHTWAKPGELLEGIPEHPVFKVFWAISRADTFAAPPNVLSARGSKLQ